MNKIYKFASGSFVLTLCAAGLISGEAQGQMPYAQSRTCVQCQEVPRALGARVCIPNTQNWGYNTPTWRVWPSERRPDVTFPQAVGAERVPTPAGVRPENVPGPQNPRQSLVNPHSGAAPAPEQPLPTINFEENKAPFEPTELLPPLEDITEAPEEKTIQAPAAIVTPVIDNNNNPLRETPSPVVTPPQSPIPETPSGVPAVLPADSLNLPIDPIIDPSMGSTNPGGTKPVDIPTTPHQETVPADMFTLPPLTHNDAGNVSPAQEANVQTAQSNIMPGGMESSSEPVVKRTIGANPMRTNSQGNVHVVNNDQMVQPVSASAIENPIPQTAPMENPMRPGKDEIKKSFRQRQTPQGQFVNNPAQSATVNPLRDLPPETPVIPESAPIAPAVAAPITPQAEDMEPLALEGFSLVKLINEEQWTPGSKEFAVVFEGRTYYCSNEQEKDAFMSEPTKYTPACRGFDPLLKLQQGREVDGKVDFCIVYGKKLYIFSCADTMNQFREHTKQYARQIAEMEE